MLNKEASSIKCVDTSARWFSRSFKEHLLSGGRRDIKLDLLLKSYVVNEVVMYVVPRKWVTVPRKWLPFQESGYHSQKVVTVQPQWIERWTRAKYAHEFCSPRQPLYISCQCLLVAKEAFGGLASSAPAAPHRFTSRGVLTSEVRCNELLTWTRIAGLELPEQYPCH